MLIAMDSSREILLESAQLQNWAQKSKKGKEIFFRFSFKLDEKKIVTFDDLLVP